MIERVGHDVGDLQNAWFWEEELKLLPEPEWVIEDTIPARSVNMLFGEFNTGKTFLALDWAACVAMGEPWVGKEVMQGDVLYIASEGDPASIGQRMDAWREARGVPESARMPLLFYADIVSFSGIKELIERAILDGLQPSVVIIDTLAMSLDSGTSENDNSAMNDAIKTLRGLQTWDHGELCFIVIHHSGWSDDGRPRGATSVPAGSDNILGLRQNSKVPSLIDVWMYKGKNMDKAKWGTMHFTLEEYGQSAALQYKSSSDAAAAIDNAKAKESVGVKLVVDFLKENPMKASGFKVSDVEGNQSTVLRALRDLQGMGRVDVVGKDGRADLWGTLTDPTKWE